MNLVIVLPIKAVNWANERAHWTRRARVTRQQRHAAHFKLKTAAAKPPAPPVVITLTRYGRRPMDTDGLSSSLKAVRDGVADWLGIDDGDARLTWRYHQLVDARGPYQVSIQIQA